MTIKKNVAEAVEKAVALVATEPLTGQVFERLQRASARRRALQADLAALALDVELGDRTAVERQAELLPQLDRTVTECTRLEAALATAHARDHAVEAERTIAELQEELATYRKVCDARVTAFRDLQVHAAASDAALRQLRSAIYLQQSGAVPKHCSLPRGYLVDHKLASVEEIEQENAFLLDLLEGQVRRISAVLRSGDPDASEVAA